MQLMGHANWWLPRRHHDLGDRRGLVLALREHQRAGKRLPGGLGPPVTGGCEQPGELDHLKRQRTHRLPAGRTGRGAIGSCDSMLSPRVARPKRIGIITSVCVVAPISAAPEMGA
jgi:hypothetical protein